MNGPAAKPSPRTIKLVSLIKPRDIICNGKKLTITDTGRAVTVAPRTGCRSPYVLGTASARTKKIITFRVTPIRTPAAPNNLPATTPVNVA